MVQNKVDQGDRWVRRLEYSSVLPGSVAQVQARTAERVPILTGSQVLVRNDACAGGARARDVVVDGQGS